MIFDLEIYTDELKAAHGSTFAEAIGNALDNELPELKRAAYFEAASTMLRHGAETGFDDQTLLEFLRVQSSLIQRFAILHCRGRINPTIQAELWQIATNDCENSLSALLELVYERDDNAMDLCLRRLHQLEFDQKAQVIATIGLTRSSSSIELLEHEYKRTTNEGLRCSLALAISRCGGENSRALLANHVMSGGQEERVPFVCELAAKRDPLGVSQLKVLLGNDDIPKTVIWRSLCIADLIDSQDSDWRTCIQDWINSLDCGEDEGET